MTLVIAAIARSSNRWKSASGSKLIYRMALVMTKSFFLSSKLRHVVSTSSTYFLGKKSSEYLNNDIHMHMSNLRSTQLMPESVCRFSQLLVVISLGYRVWRSLGWRFLIDRSGKYWTIWGSWPCGIRVVSDIQRYSLHGSLGGRVCKHFLMFEMWHKRLNWSWGQCWLVAGTEVCGRLGVPLPHTGTIHLQGPINHLIT